MDNLVLSVYELNRYVADKLAGDPLLEEVWVQGEVSGVSLRYNTLYFSLKDEQAVVECMIFDCDVTDIPVESIYEGQKILVRGEASVYWKSGRYRFVAQQVRLAGAGELLARFNEIKERLEKQGVFAEERKKPLPRYPRKIGIVTSKAGAAIRDIENIARRRDHSVQLLLYAVRVQGQGAPDEIVRGIAYFNENTDVDLLIVGRGGGSAEDLFAFNEERVVLAVADSRIPVVSAVGHETDFTLCDMAADLRAPTPSAAAEIAVPAAADTLNAVNVLRGQLGSGLRNLLRGRRETLEYRRGMLSADRLMLRIGAYRSRLSGYRLEMGHNAREALGRRAAQLQHARTVLESLNPYQAFARGYSIAMKEGKALRSAHGVAAGDEITTVLADGEVVSIVKEAKWKEREHGKGKGSGRIPG